MEKRDKHASEVEISVSQAVILVLHAEILTPIKSVVILFYWNTLDYFKTLDSKACGY